MSSPAWVPSHVTAWTQVLIVSICIRAVTVVTRRQQVLLDVSTTSAGAQNGAALQLDALHCLAVQHHRLLLPVVEALVPIPASTQPARIY